jgi:Alpha/beta hydrolase domain
MHGRHGTGCAAPTTRPRRLTSDDVSDSIANEHIARLLPIRAGAGNPETSATRPPSEFDDALPAFSADYIEGEHLLAGTGCRYTGPATGPARVDSSENCYITRVLARYPRHKRRFSGRVLVEPFNTTYGNDRDALWLHTGSMLQAHGDAWIGISVRASSSVALKRHDPQRYRDVDIPSNDLAWSLLQAIGTLIKLGGEHSPLAELPVRQVYLGGYSQSGVDTATFAAAFGAGTRTADGRTVFDGFFPACHAASMTPIAAGGAELPRFEYAAMPAVGIPVIEVQPQSDVEGFSFDQFVNPGSASIRRDDSDTTADRFRLYEIGGAPHAAKIAGCDGDGSSFPVSAFVRGALLQLFLWVEDGLIPPRAPRIALAIDETVAEAAVDQYGNAVGGVPSPFLNVPIARYEVHSTPGPLCKLAGREVSLPAQVLSERYGDVDTYLAEFSASLDAVIDAGFLWAGDRAELLQAQRLKARDAFAVAASNTATST